MERYLFFIFLGLVAGNEIRDVKETEMFSIAITPQMFNWTYQASDTQYTFHASLLNKPDLPTWLHYVYSDRHHSGFLYGTPYGQKDVLIQVVALNRQDYETRRMVIQLHVLKKVNIATYNVQLKIDNLNVEDMLDDHRMERLKDVFRKKLWRDSGDDLYTTFMASAIDLGARLPLRPSEGEGVVLKLGSHLNYSAELLQLQEEVRPLSKMSLCPRDFKRTTVERLFRDAGFNLDWCTFKLVEQPKPSVVRPGLVSVLKRDEDKDQLSLYSEAGLSRWLPPPKELVPQRSYAGEFTVSIIVPLMLMLLLLSVLGLVTCFQREGMEDREYVEFLHNLFQPCTQYVQNKRSNCNRVKNRQVQNSVMTEANASSSTANLNTHIADDMSDKTNLGISPNNSMAKPRSNPNLEVDFNRPQPPPYLGSNTNSLVLRHHPTVGDDLPSKKHRARTLEESLQLLNEANIGNRGYVEGIHLPDHLTPGDLLMADAANSMDEDYVPLKPDLSGRRGNGFVNGSVNNNGGLLKGMNGF